MRKNQVFEARRNIAKAISGAAALLLINDWNVQGSSKSFDQAVEQLKVWECAGGLTVPFAVVGAEPDG